jgi:hypothetical protein
MNEPRLSARCCLVVERTEGEGMDGTVIGPTPLEDLLQRLGALERECAELRGKVATLESAEGRRDEEAEPSPSEGSEGLEQSRISRRRLLGRAGVAAASLVVAGTLTQRDIREARAASPATTFETNDPNVPAVLGKHTFGGTGVRGEGLYGITGQSNGATGQGVHGSNSTAGDGVLGDSQGGAAIRGRSFGSTGAGVHGEHFGSGYGGLFKGGRSQLKLVPSDRSGRPKGGIHSKGEIYMDSNAVLFMCVRGGTPGRWRKVSTSAV